MCQFAHEDERAAQVFVEGPRQMRLRLRGSHARLMRVANGGQ
eukprot:CAMPEP_0119519826 /NCGR_PEP_ID=MMETSP1344-20130328/36007_1 /TAXON_ID=236787 /ORGANISM="Florenciella parvula, Strain CCMP2471" /LENGTH=41 /DNA_ID= /DNA_START= /DNA_END= /DNA_ORIENTATION=